MFVNMILLGNYREKQGVSTMRTISKQILTGTIAATLMLGGIGLVQKQAFANATDTSTDQNVTLKYPNINLVQETASFTYVGEEKILDTLNQNKSLIQAVWNHSGFTENEYLEHLTKVEGQQIADALSLGKLTQEQADKEQSDLKTRLKQTIEATPHDLLAGQSPYDIAQTKGISEERLFADVFNQNLAEYTKNSESTLPASSNK
jgi:hypothetical protein